MDKKFLLDVNLHFKLLYETGLVLNAWAVHLRLIRLNLLIPFGRKGSHHSSSSLSNTEMSMMEELIKRMIQRSQQNMG